MTRKSKPLQATEIPTPKLPCHPCHPVVESFQTFRNFCAISVDLECFVGDFEQFRAEFGTFRATNATFSDGIPCSRPLLPPVPHQQQNFPPLGMEPTQDYQNLPSDDTEYMMKSKFLCVKNVLNRRFCF